MAHTPVILTLPSGKELKKCKLEKYVNMLCSVVCHTVLHCMVYLNIQGCCCMYDCVCACEWVCVCMTVCVQVLC